MSSHISSKIHTPVLLDALNAMGDTRLVFTSRESLPAPFDAEWNRCELHRLDREDAVKLVERALNQEPGGSGAAANTTREQIEQLVDTVHGHARTLALLAPTLRIHGVEATRGSLAELMAEMERKFPGSREQSLFASVELSLRRLSSANREKARALAPFRGGVQLDVPASMMEWEPDDVASLAEELIGTGLATMESHYHLALHPALCPYLRAVIGAPELQGLLTRWEGVMASYLRDLAGARHREGEIIATLTLLELPNFLTLLERVQRTRNAEAVLSVISMLFGLLGHLGMPSLLHRLTAAREGAERDLSAGWTAAHFEARRLRIDQQLATGQLREAIGNARELLQRARLAGDQAYPSADHDHAHACFLLARALRRTGESDQALPLLDEAQQRFDAIANGRSDGGAARMACASIIDRGSCLIRLGRLDEARSAFEESNRRAEESGGTRNLGVGKGQLGTIHRIQGRYAEALEAHAEAQELFARLNEPREVAGSWHRIGMTYLDAGDLERAEDAYRSALEIAVQLGNSELQAVVLNELGTVYHRGWGRPEEAVHFYRQAVNKFVECGVAAGESQARNNLANSLIALRRFDDARQEIRRVIECDTQFGHTSEPWTAWSILAAIEEASGSPHAAAAAKQKAVECYLSYRRDGGENPYDDGRIVHAVAQHLLTGNAAAATSLLHELAASSQLSTSGQAFVAALQAITSGSRDRALADAPELNITMAAEIHLLLEALEREGC